MPTLEQILKMGIFSAGEDTLRGSMVSFNEQLAAQEFAEDINSGRISVEDAYQSFWSYEEDYFGVKGRMLLPKWRNTLSFLIGMIDDKNPESLLEASWASYFMTKSSFKKYEYNPFLEDCLKNTQIFINRPFFNESGIAAISEELISLLNLEFASSSRNEGYKKVAYALSALGRTKEVIDCAEINWVHGKFRGREYELIKMLEEFKDNHATPFIMRLCRQDINKTNSSGCSYNLLLYTDALSIIGSKESIDALKEIFHKTGEGCFQLINHKEGISFLFEVANDKHHPYKYQAIDSLLHKKYSPVIPITIDYNRNESEEYRKGAPLFQISRFCPEYPGLTEEIMKLLDNKNSHNRELLAIALFNVLGDKSRDVLIDYLREGLNPETKFNDTRCGSIPELLMKIGDEKSIEALIDIAFDKNVSDQERERVATAFGEHPDKEKAVKLLKIFLDNNTLTEEYTSFISLREINTDEAKSIIRDYARRPFPNDAIYYLDPNDHLDLEIIRERLYLSSQDANKAMFVLAKNKDRGLPILFGLLSDKSYKYRSMIPEKIKDMKGYGSEELFLSYLKEKELNLSEKDQKNSEIIIRLLGHVGTSRALHYLKKLLFSNNRDLRWSAIEAMGKIGDESAIDFLEKYCHEHTNLPLYSADRIHAPMGEVERNYISRALAKISGLKALTLLKEIIDNYSYLTDEYGHTMDYNQYVEAICTQLKPKGYKAK